MLRYPVFYQEISSEFSSEFFGLVDSATKIVITAHESPDEDSISSILLIYRLITTNYPQKNVRLLYGSDPDTKYKVFENFAKIEFVDDIADHLNNTDLLIMLDGGNFSRFSKKPEILKSVSKTIAIDHHTSIPDEFTLSLVAPQYPACAEVIYRSLFTGFSIDKPLAEIFLLGILGDTGNFNYIKPHQSDTLAVTQKLLEISQVEMQEFQSRYQLISLRVFSIVQEFIKNTQYQSVGGWPDFQYSFITRNYLKKYQLSNPEVSEASHIYSTNFVRTLEGYSWGVVFSPNTNGDINISCRSLPGSTNVRDLMERFIKGGGHDRASGGTYKSTTKPLDVIFSIKLFMKWIKSHTPVLG
jgi:phosphoesterase RecJ-like protein